MFRGQFTFTPTENKQLREFNLFTALINVKQWYSASFSVAAPGNDLALLKKLDIYKRFASAISTTAITALKRHLRYLSELVALSLFSEEVPPDVKRKMVQGLSKEPAKKSVKRLEGASLKDVHLMSLSDLFTSK